MIKLAASLFAVLALAAAPAYAAKGGGMSEDGEDRPTFEDGPTFIVITGGLPTVEPQRAVVDGVEIIRRPSESLDDFKAYLRTLVKDKDSVIVIGGLPE
jgi:hypothetical protein